MNLRNKKCYVNEQPISQTNKKGRLENLCILMEFFSYIFLAFTFFLAIVNFKPIEQIQYYSYNYPQIREFLGYSISDFKIGHQYFLE